MSEKKSKKNAKLETQVEMQINYVNSKVLEYIKDQNIPDEDIYSTFSRMTKKGEHIIISGSHGKFQNVIKAIIDVNTSKARAEILNEFREKNGEDDFNELKDYLDSYGLLSSDFYQEWYKENSKK